MKMYSGGYKVKSGYKIYNDQDDYDAGIVAMSDNGFAQTFSFAGASTLFAGAAMLTASLLA